MTEGVPWHKEIKICNARVLLHPTGVGSPLAEGAYVNEIKASLLREVALRQQ